MSNIDQLKKAYEEEILRRQYEAMMRQLNTPLQANQLMQEQANQLRQVQANQLLNATTITSTGLHGLNTSNLIWDEYSMATPESKVKTKAKQALDDLDVYYTMPVTGGYGNSGVPDILACIEGVFFGIECKAGNNKPTALQEKHMADIVKAGGVSMVVDETNVGTLKELILAKLGDRK